MVIAEKIYSIMVPPAATGSTAAPEPRPEHEASFSGSGSAEKLV